jgi:hypothetical protein
MKIEAPETRRLRHFLPDQEQRVRVEYDVHFLVAHLRRELRILDEFYRPSRMSKLGRQIYPSVLLSRRCHNSNDPNAALLQRLQCAHPGRFFTYQDDVHASHKGY